MALSTAPTYLMTPHSSAGLREESPAVLSSDGDVRCQLSLAQGWANWIDAPFDAWLTAAQAFNAQPDPMMVVDRREPSTDFDRLCHAAATLDVPSVVKCVRDGLPHVTLSDTMSLFPLAHGRTIARFQSPTEEVVATPLLYLLLARPASGDWSPQSLDAQSLILGLLLTAGMAPDRNVFKRALNHDNPDLLNLLLAHTPNPSDTFPTLLVDLFHAPQEPIHVDSMIDLFVEHGYNVDTPVKVGRNDEMECPLQAAVRHGDVRGILALLSHGVSIPEPSYNGLNLLQEVNVKARTTEVYEQLLDHGISPDGLDSMGNRAINTFAMANNIVGMKVLIAIGVDLEARDNLANATPLLLAVERGHAEAVDLLIASGANLNVRDHRNKNLLQMAQESMAQDQSKNPDGFRQTLMILEQRVLRSSLKDVFPESEDAPPRQRARL